MKKLKNPGDNISLKTKKSEDPAIMEWINSQSNLMDSIRYLIENEVRQNGVRNLQSFIPADRSLAVAPIMATMGHAAADPALHAASSSAAEVAAGSMPAADAAVVEAGEETPEDDNIDEEDIESWL